MSAATVTDTTTPYVLEPGEGEVLHWFSTAFTVKAEHPALGILDCSVPAGDEPPMHVHKHEDEWLIVLEGEMTFYAGELVRRGGPGTVAYFPRALPHTFVVETERARMLVLASPGGFVRVFERAPASPEEAAAALIVYGADPVGPNPRELR